MRDLALRPLMPKDEPAARDLIERSFSGTRYLARLREQLDAALQFEDPEYLAVLAEHDDVAVALALFGTVAGARGCTRLHVLAGHDRDALDALALGVVQVCAEAGERLIVAEVPDDATFAAGLASLEAARFRDEGRADDYVADVTALRLLVWRPGRP
jgi:hypothetical protein